MKSFISLCATLIFSFSSCFGQAQYFPIDSVTKKISYTNIEVLDSSYSAALLYKNAEQFFQSNFPKAAEYNTQFDLKEGFISCQGKYMVFTKGGPSPQPHGQITYDIKVEVKNTKYRYTFTNFVFEYFTQNRDTKYVPSGRMKPLETPKYPGWQSVWNKHKRKNNEMIIGLIQKLKQTMSQKAKEALPVPPKPKNEW